MDYIDYFVNRDEIIPKERMKFRYVEEQNYDNSCGIAAVATLLTTFYNTNLNEIEIIESLFSEKKGKDDKYSLKDLSTILTKYDFYNKSYKINFEELINVVDKYSPIIIHYAKPDTHFVVVISRSNDRFIIADPARGIKLIEKKELVEKWSGIILVGVSEKHTKNKEVIEEITKNEIKKREKLERDLK